MSRLASVLENNTPILILAFVILFALLLLALRAGR